MNIIIPMAGEGKRFQEEGYTIHKPQIPTTDRKTGSKIPMVVCAAMDLPGVMEGGKNITFIDRTFHKLQGVEQTILEYYNEAAFLTAEQLTQGQACTCLLAKEIINNEKELLIAGCDNGMVMDTEAYEKSKENSDALIFVYRHDPFVCDNPSSFGWVVPDEQSRVTGISIKKPVSDTPMDDYAVVATFWFRHGSEFVEAAERMIALDDRINGEFYVDQVMKYVIQMGLHVKIFEVDRYIGWGTPKSYETYENTIAYWRHFAESKDFLGIV